MFAILYCHPFKLVLEDYLNLKTGENNIGWGNKLIQCRFNVQTQINGGMNDEWRWNRLIMVWLDGIKWNDEHPLIVILSITAYDLYREHEKRTGKF